MNATLRFTGPLLLAIGLALILTPPTFAQSKAKPAGAQTIQERHARVSYQKQMTKQDGNGRTYAARVIRESHWMLGVSGWFDSEGLNLTYIMPGSTVQRLTDRPAGRGRRYTLEIGDIVAAVDGQPVTTY